MKPDSLLMYNIFFVYVNVQVYIFMCPLCEDNEDPGSVIETVVENLREDGVNYTNIWIDVEQCDGCWSDDLDVRFADL